MNFFEAAVSGRDIRPLSKDDEWLWRPAMSWIQFYLHIIRSFDNWEVKPEPTPAPRRRVMSEKEMTSAEVIAKALLEPGTKIVDTYGEIFWTTVSSDGRVYWYSDNEPVSDELFNTGKIYELYKEPAKLVKWYRPKIIWIAGQDSPQRTEALLIKDGEKSFCCFSPGKYPGNWQRQYNYKVLEWDEIEAPETSEECE